jgi:serine/threonine-protein kinase HipA
MKHTLYVHYRQQLVGELTLTESGQMQFRYCEQWRVKESGFPISLSLPLEGLLTTSASHHFFANLLPEANVRQQICQSLKISPSNDFELLKAIGGDCAGALTISPFTEPEPKHSSPDYEPVTEDQLGQWSVGAPNAFPAVTGQNEVRLSLAGAQDKLPVHVQGDQILIPRGNTPSTHLLKFASLHYSHLPENETFVSLLASEVGLPVVDVGIRRTPRASVALIRRYDRAFVDGEYIRLHQEDFCQSLGISAMQKYEREGGPSLKQCAEIIRRHTAFPLLDLQHLLQWALFNLLVGNADAHGKNLSLLYDASGSPCLAPFYDLVCTRNYKRISREMAMNLGGAWDPDLVTTRHLDALASDLSFRGRVVCVAADTLVDKLSAAIPKTIESYEERFGNTPVLQRLPIIVRKLIRRFRSGRR